MTSLLLISVQASGPWHDRGMFMGMHWVWWSVWILTVAMLFWALWSLYADRRGMRRRVTRQGLAEESLREEFAKDQITEEEFTKRMRIIRESASGMV